ncbi:hypothetical protein CEXT_171421 [Caerostris extrusa]|uniref:Secreted protein n=1 Tax=Caerostris extrusa TaxID=172846 RepID=A0AAV4NQ51_CAEEX|nr:hypothetical protein CEXT_171421 [Caerostris extrusa]
MGCRFQQDGRFASGLMPFVVLSCSAHVHWEIGVYRDQCIVQDGRFASGLVPFVVLSCSAHVHWEIGVSRDQCIIVKK